MSTLKDCLDYVYDNIGNSSSVYQCDLRIKEIEEICVKRLSKSELSKQLVCLM